MLIAGKIAMNAKWLPVRIAFLLPFGTPTKLPAFAQNPIWRAINSDSETKIAIRRPAVDCDR